MSVSERERIPEPFGGYYYFAMAYYHVRTRQQFHQNSLTKHNNVAYMLACVQDSEEDVRYLEGRLFQFLHRDGIHTDAQLRKRRIEFLEIAERRLRR